MRLLHLDKPPAPLTSLLKLQFAFLRKRDIEDGTAWFINRLILLSCSFLARTHPRVYLVHLLSTRYTRSVPRGGPGNYSTFAHHELTVDTGSF